MELKESKCVVVLKSALKQVVEIVIPGHLTESFIPRAIEELKHDAEIPGFRKGRATSVAVQAHYGEKRVRELAADLLARDAFSQVSEILPDKPATPPDFLLPGLNPVLSAEGFYFRNERCLRCQNQKDRFHCFSQSFF
jgi:FKBP-type peptidyl-prolyl cis-trans isomerase (trigger factor)